VQTTTSRDTPRVVGGLFALCVVATAAYVVSLLPGVRPGPGYAPVWEIGVYVTVFASAALTALSRGLLVPRGRGPWLALGTGLLLYACGTVYFAVLTQRLADPPYPSLADALWLSFYPAAFVAIVLLVRQTSRRFRPSMWLDGLVAGLGGAAVAATFAFGPIMASAGKGSFAAIATNFAYPVADLLLLVLVLGALALLGPRSGLVWWLVAGGLAAFAAADTWFLSQVYAGTYQPASAVDATWAVGGCLIAAAAWRGPRAQDRSQEQGWAVLAIPALFAVLALLVLAYSSSLVAAPLGVVLATAALVASFVRTGLTFREVLALADSRRLARTDDVTGLPNRRALFASLTGRAGGGEPTALLLVDLVRFVEVNNALGQRTGDEVLRLAGTRIREMLDEGEMLARLGDDEFAVLLPGADEERALGTAHRVQAAFGSPFHVAGLRMYLDVRIGVTVAPPTRVERSLEDADLALARAKQQPGGVHLLTDGDARDDEARLATAAELREALDTDQLVVHLQPQLDLADGRCTGVEALVRWQHPTSGLLSPAHFLTVAERSGLMPRLSIAVLRCAADEAVRLRTLGHRVPVAVNLSPTNLLDADLPSQVRALLEERGLPPDALEVEITEQALMSDGRALEVLEALRAMGLRIALDDFGTGYSSLTHLQTLPVHVVKIDLSFVRRLRTDPRAVAIVRSVIDLAHALGLRVVGEGVEDAQTQDVLASMGCDVAQGFHIGRPVPGDVLVETLATWRPGVRGAVSA
jgi:diguanylate cyclase